MTTLGWKKWKTTSTIIWSCRISNCQNKLLLKYQRFLLRLVPASLKKKLNIVKIAPWIWTLPVKIVNLINLLLTKVRKMSIILLRNKIKIIRRSLLHLRSRQKKFLLLLILSFSRKIKCLWLSRLKWTNLVYTSQLKNTGVKNQSKAKISPHFRKIVQLPRYPFSGRPPIERNQNMPNHRSKCWLRNIQFDIRQKQTTMIMSPQSWRRATSIPKIWPTAEVLWRWIKVEYDICNLTFYNNNSSLSIAIILLTLNSSNCALVSIIVADQAYPDVSLLEIAQ